MNDYRLYVFDRTGHIRGVTVLNCQDDEEAMAYAAVHSEGRITELWQRDRQVRTFARREDD